MSQPSSSCGAAVVDAFLETAPEPCEDAVVEAGLGASSLWAHASCDVRARAWSAATAAPAPECYNSVSDIVDP